MRRHGGDATETPRTIKMPVKGPRSAYFPRDIASAEGDAEE